MVLDCFWHLSKEVGLNNINNIKCVFQKVKVYQVDASRCSLPFFVKERLHIYVFLFYTFNMPSEVRDKTTQQINPSKIGLAPLFTSFTRLVLRPIEARAITMTNLPVCARKPLMPYGMGRNVLITEAATNPSTNHGNILPIL